jgi:uncharacterized protein YbjT (DUF2867 family)
MLYTIMGATGNVGNKIANILLDRHENIRVISRTRDNLRHLQARGAEAFAGDAADPDFLTRAFTNADCVFTMIPSDIKAEDYRAYQNRIGESVARAIGNAALKCVVNLSSIGAELSEGNGPIGGLHDQEQRLSKLEKVNVLHIRSATFMDNLLKDIDEINAVGALSCSVGGDLKLAMIATRDVAKFGADCMARKNFLGKAVKELLGQRDLTLEEAAKVIGRKIGKPNLRYATLSYTDAHKRMVERGFSADACRLFNEMSKGLNNGLFGLGKVVRTKDNTTETSIEEFADHFAKVYRSTISRKAA